jgi:hypothetical protein
MSGKRFRVAFSFAGEKRSFVSKVAAILASRFGEDAILYDKYHEAEFARPRLGRYLPRLSREQADLIIVVICKNYGQKEWPGLEWDAVFDLLKKRQEEEVMLCRFDQASVEGLFSDAGYVELDDKTPAITAQLILQRLALREGKAKGYYLDAESYADAAQLVAIHLHPDFRAELGGLIEVWNSDQAQLIFTPVCPPQDIESRLLSGDPIEGVAAQEIATRMRKLAEFEAEDGIIQFCEGRLFGDDCFQLYSWTTPPNGRLNSSTISLFLKRELAKSAQVKAPLFSFVIQSMLYALGTVGGLPQHGVTRTCIMDFNNNMSDMDLGLDYGPKFCPTCEAQCHNQGNEYLLKLAASAKKYLTGTT